MALPNNGLPATVTVHRCRPGEPLDRESWRCLIMGPIGAGKSSFIEALAGPNSSIADLSSDQLESFTKDVQAYEITGIDCVPRDAILLIDTPGFGDSKISQYEIVSKIKEWMKENDVEYFHRILYISPITSTRLAGSHRGVIECVKALSGRKAASGVGIITSMWNVVWGDKAQKRADNNFDQLQNETWNDFIKQGTHIVKFDNTHVSAVSIMTKLLQKFHVDIFTIDGLDDDDLNSQPYSEHLRKDLATRIHALHIRREVLASELESCSVAADKELEEALKLQFELVKEDVARFEGQMEQLDQPPLPESS
ncbi:hypothetical protein CVT24_011350 [Panaeolus cyanescens]|uniref:G domain-containing protein n=1 Tax=Panaeolus cyanescens TaxID=181874 RepID=A0A409YGK3_9AGAR|nr:hypothetical protein CVT24_011350 [Panaeolus cyanescens]